MSLIPVEFPYGSPIQKVGLKARHEDFIVTESIPFTPSGEGEHHYLFLKKCGVNTAFLAKKLQDVTGLPEVAIGYAGRKDRHAVTSQWFSVHSHQSYSWSSIISDISDELSDRSGGKESVELLDVTLHSSKLRKGDVLNNRFSIIVREQNSAGANNDAEIEKRIHQITEYGFVNYYGMQRFSSLLPAIEAATNSRSEQSNSFELTDELWDQLLTDLFRAKLKKRRRGRKGFDLSIARSFLFNRILSDAVGKGSLLLDEQLPLYGESRDYLWSESPFFTVIKGYPQLTELICAQRVQLGWRTARLLPEAFSYQRITPTELLFQFTLPAGCFATSLLAHLFQFES